MAQARKPRVPRHRSHNLPPRDGQQLKKNVTPKLGSRIVTIVQTQRKCYMCFEGLRSTLRSLAIAHRAVTETIGKRVSRYERSRYSSPLLFSHGGRAHPKTICIGPPSFPECSTGCGGRPKALSARALKAAGSPCCNFLASPTLIDS